MQIEWIAKKVKVSELRDYENNPRYFTEKGINDLKKSIGKFGLAEPLCCNPNLTIIGGHARKKTLQELNIKEVNVYIPSRELNPDEIKELNIRLNKNVAGEWDFDILANDFELGDLLDWGFEEMDFGVGKDFEPVDIEEQGKLDQKKPKFINCPHCGEEFDINGQS